jgi:hypothetical protein
MVGVGASREAHGGAHRRGERGGRRGGEEGAAARGARGEGRLLGALGLLGPWLLCSVSMCFM